MSVLVARWLPPMVQYTTIFCLNPNRRATFFFSLSFVWGSGRRDRGCAFPLHIRLGEGQNGNGDSVSSRTQERVRFGHGSGAERNGRTATNERQTDSARQRNGNGSRNGRPTTAERPRQNGKKSRPHRAGQTPPMRDRSVSDSGRQRVRRREPKH